MSNKNDKRSPQIRVNVTLSKELHRKHVKKACDLHLSFSAYVRLCLEQQGKSTDSLPFKGTVLPFRDDS